MAVLLVGAARGYWAERRRREAALLAARGVGPAGIAVKALLEVLPAALLGGWPAAQARGCWRPVWGRPASWNRVHVPRRR